MDLVLVAGLTLIVVGGVGLILVLALYGRKPSRTLASRTGIPASRGSAVSRPRFRLRNVGDAALESRKARDSARIAGHRATRWLVLLLTKGLPLADRPQLRWHRWTIHWHGCSPLRLCLVPLALSH